jgi:putative flippase GtrA
MTMSLQKSVSRFLRYTTIGVGTLLIDLALLYLATTYLHIPYYIATGLSFLIAVSINYSLSRAHIFRGTERSWHRGYLYFALIGIGGALLTTALVVLLVSTFGLYYIFARILVAGIVGIVNYLSNLYFTFKVAGTHL